MVENSSNIGYLLQSLKKQRRYALVGIALALIGVAFQNVGAAVPWGDRADLEETRLMT
jgi:hypothetical protein